MADQDPIDPILNSQEVKEFAKNVETLKDSLFGAIDNAKDITVALRDGSQSTRDTYMNVNKTRDALEDITDLYSRLGTQYISEERINTRIVKNDMMRETILERIAKTSNSIGESQEYINGIIEHIKSNSFEITTADDNILKLLVQQLDTVDGLSVSYNHILSKLDEENDKFIGMNLKASGLAKIFAFISKIPVLGQFMRFDIISQAFLKDFPTGIKAITTQLKGLLAQPLVGFAMIGFALKEIISSVLKMNENMTKVGNNLGMSSNAVKIMYDGFRQSSLEGTKLVGSLDNAFLSVRNMVNASLELQDSLETNAMFTNQMIQGQMLMTKQMGMTAEEAAGIQKFSLLTGKSAESILQSAIKQNNTVISYRKILKEVSTISAELSMRYGNDPEKIAAAVVQANKLGMSLEETRKISSSLLNFESSIEGELESELLLGRQFNFEKARELALAGKSAEAAGDLLRQMGGVHEQMGGIHEFEKMNVIQRERFAAAIGLSSDELSKAVKEQSVLTALGEQNRQGLEERYELLRKSNDQAGLAVLQAEAAKVEGGKVMLQDIARASINQRFEESVNRIKDVFTEMAVPLGNIMDKIAKLLEHTFVLKSVLVLAAAAMTSIAISATIASFGAAAAAAAPWIAGIGAAAAGVGMISAVNDSMISPSGQIMISTPQGNILPNKNDSIITTTNPGGLLNGGGGGDNLVASKIDELIGHVKKGGNVYIDSTRSGTAYGMSYNSYA